MLGKTRTHFAIQLDVMLTVDVFTDNIEMFGWRPRGQWVHAQVWSAQLKQVSFPPVFLSTGVSSLQVSPLHRCLLSMCRSSIPIAR